MPEKFDMKEPRKALKSVTRGVDKIRKDASSNYGLGKRMGKSTGILQRKRR